jgi:hypothetical protein
MSVASEFYFTLSAVMEEYDYTNPVEFGSVLQARLIAAYSDPSISGEYLSLCVQNGAEYLTLASEILFSEPRFSNIIVEIVQTNSPTAVPDKGSSTRNTNPLSGAVPPVYLYASGGVIFLLIVICSLLAVRNCQKSKRHLPTREAPANKKDKSQEFDFDEVDFYSPTNLPDRTTPKSVLKTTQSEKQKKYREKLSSSGLQADEPVFIEMKTMESAEHQDRGEIIPEAGRDQTTKPRAPRITHIGAGSGAPKKKLTLSTSP